MILVDSSVWIDHFANPIAALVDLAAIRQLLAHPFVVGELALGSIKNRPQIMKGLLDLPKAVVANDDEVLAMIERRSLFSRGISYVDAHLLASALLTDETKLWSFDRRLHMIAVELNCAANLPGKTAN